MYRPAINEFIGSSGSTGGSSGSSSTPVATQYISLDSTYKTPTSSNYAPIYNLPAPISCAQDEYIDITVQRLNFYNDITDVPEGSQITFTKTGGSPFTVTLAKYGKPLVGSLTALLTNAYRIPSGDAAFTCAYDSTSGGIIMTFSTQTTMSFPSGTGDDLARYLGYAPGDSITSASNKIQTPPLRPQKYINIALCAESLSALKPSYIANQWRTSLCIFPILANPYLLAMYRTYINREMSVRIREKFIQGIALRFVDTATGETVPVKEHHITLQIDTYKV